MPGYKADVIVIGAGIAGVTPSIELIERGRSVIVLGRETWRSNRRRPQRAGAIAVADYALVPKRSPIASGMFLILKAKKIFNRPIRIAQPATM